MKRLLLALGILLIIGAFSFKVWADTRHVQQLAIMSVFTQAQAALIQIRTFNNGRTLIVHANNKLFSVKEYVTALDRIPTTQCPQAFQTAWLNYVQTCERQQEPFNLLAAGVEGVVGVYKLSPSVTQDALARLDRLNAPEAWRRVIMVALEHGVQIHDR